MEKHNMASRNRQTIIAVTVTMAVLFISLFIGRMNISKTEILTIILDLFLNREFSSDMSSKGLVFTQIRLPRCLMALVVGMGLSAAGAVYQSLFRNPLVSPGILGVGAGCTFGAAIGLMLPESSFLIVRVLAFSFGLLAVLMALGLAKAVSVKPVIVLVLAGMVVMSLFNAGLMVMKYMADPYEELPSIVFWTMGGFHRVTWQDVYSTFPITGIGIILFFLVRFRLNVISLGDVQAKSLGMNPTLFRLILIIMSSLIVALAVSTCGQIAWVGLVIPHIARTIVGPNHQKMMPITIFIGGIFMLIADNFARTLTTAEIPVGIITSFTGAPFFAYLLYKNRGRGWV